MIKYIAAMKFSAFFLLACGAVVHNSEALAGLEAVAKGYFIPHLSIYALLSHTIASVLQTHLLLGPSTSLATKLHLGWCRILSRQL